MATNAGIIIRKAKRDDMIHVLGLIKDLAAFEKMEDSVKIDSKTLENDCFGEFPVFYCLVAEANKEKLVGYAIYYICYSTWLGRSIFLEDIYVDDAYRNSGIGKELFKTVSKIANDMSGRMDFHVLSWNPAIDFYKRMGAIDLTEEESWKLFRVSGEGLKKIVE